MFKKSVWLTGLLILSAFTANAQTYWLTDPNLNCGAYGDSNGNPLQLDSGTYVCYVYGTFPWYATGADWGRNSIRVSAPPSAPVAYFFDFSGVNGSDATLDFLYLGDSTVYSGTAASGSLYANQPMEVDILGLHSQAPAYLYPSNGPVVVLAECPDANTCSQVQAQLIYSALAAEPWSWWCSVPVVWDWQTSQGWSTVGIDNGSTDLVALVIYNLDTVGQATQTYTINVYDATGTLSATATTAPVPLYGSYANLLRDVMPSLPSGAFKLQVVGSAYTAFEALQFHGPSVTALVAASEVVPAATASSSAIGRNRHPSPAALRMAPPRRSST